jgi:enoyl-CoA hydratase/carnithine racemase
MALLERQRLDDGIEVWRLNRPEVRNAIDSALLAEFEAAFADARSDESLRVLVVSTTNVQALCAGADVGESLTAAEGVARMEAFARFYTGWDELPVPVVAVAVGNCVGAGAELVAAADLRVAGDNLKLAWAGARLGVPVGPARLAPLVGLSVAKEWVFTGRVVGADEASRVGLAHRVAPADSAESEALDLARAVAANNAAGLRRLKAMFHEYDGTSSRVAAENAELIAFQRSGTGLPQGSRD